MQEITRGWKHGILYKKSWQKNIKLKKNNFSWKHKEIDSIFTSISFSNHDVFHWVCIKLITNFKKIWNNKSREQILLNLTSQYGVQKYFCIRKINEIDLCEVIT